MWDIESGGVLKVAHADHELSRARLRREAEALDQIGAPWVPEILGQGVLADGRPWIAMERVLGITLADLVAAGRTQLDEVVRIGGQILDALDGVHAAGFVHRDIKPDNIVRRSDGRLVLLDLGLAHKYPDDPDDPTRANVQVGSLEYIAPEQLADASSVDPRADLYAFGCVLFELIAGRPPFVGDAATLERAHAAMRPPPLGTLVTVPAAIEALVADLLAKDPARRPASAREAKQRLYAVRNDTMQAIEGRSMSVIAEGKQPVVLVWVELPRIDRAVLARLAARKVIVLSQRGRRILGALIGGDHADPAVAAIAAARDLVANGARVALHLDLMRVTPTASGLAPVGDAVDTPDAWLPPGAWTGMLFTRAFAAVVQAPTRPSEVEGLAEFRAPVEADAVVLFGREALLSDLVAHASATIGPRSRGPGFAIVTGEAGVGKTVVAAELAVRLRALGVRVELATIPPPGTTHAAFTALANLVNTPAPGIAIVRGIGDALRAAARARPTVIVIDDLQFADHDLLDALEYATLGGEPLPLWIAGIASSRLDERRPSLGARAERHRRDVLGPLDAESAMAFTAKLLEPAQYPPLRALRKLVELARGNPLHLTMLAREVHERGAVRTRAGGEHFLDTTALDALPPIALGPWLAARELAGASVELVALARLCAVLGGEVDRAQLAAVVERVERGGGASTPIDLDVGLRELAASGLVVASTHGWRFRQTLLEEGLYTTTAEADRIAIHRAALAHWTTMPATEPAVIAQIARHAEASGELDLAGDAYAQLGERAHAEHRIFDADQAWDRAVASLPAGDWRRARALLGRARARERLLRIGEALADLDAAVAIAVAIGELGLEIEVRLEQATALDLRFDFPGSRDAAREARTRSAELAADDDLAVELDLAEARSHFRDQEIATALVELARVRDRARNLGMHEAEIVAGLMLGPALVVEGELDRAVGMFDELIATCTARDDRFHLGAALVNRAFLWSALGKPDRTADDLRLVIQLARENGQPAIERNATYNLAEDRLWQGSLDEAIRLAERSLALQRDHGEGSTQLDELLLARALAAAARPELAALVDKLLAEEISEDDRTVLRVLALVARSAARDAWVPVYADVEALPDETRLELGHLALRHDALSLEQRQGLAKLAGQSPFWAGRFD